MRVKAGRRRPVSQSAMEYLMTYGWAILIIAVVLGALYSLGVFNTTSLQPKVPGGGCHVFRPNGPGTSWNVNLVGSCNNALPQYTAQFNGQSSYVDFGASTTLGVPGTQTQTAWVKWIGTVPSSGYTIVGKLYYTYLQIGEYGLGDSKIAVWFNAPISKWFESSATVSPNVWHFVSFTYDTSSISFYLDGSAAGSNTVTGIMTGGISNLTIGDLHGYARYFSGSIANVQVYNTSLTANQVKYLYNEGIGGVPISPQYLVGWWPLNGDTLDYSGNGNNGVPTAITYNGSWTGGYYR